MRLFTLGSVLQVKIHLHLDGVKGGAALHHESIQTQLEEMLQIEIRNKET